MTTEGKIAPVRPLSVGVVGCGYWGVNYVRLLNELPMVSDILVFDQRPQRLREIGRRFPRVRLIDTMDALLASNACDAVIVSTPAETHLKVAEPIIRSGTHVLIEKPITTNSEDAEELIELAHRHGVTLAVGHTFVHHSAVQKVKSYVDSGAAGMVYYLYSRRTNLGPIRSDVDALWDLAPHDVSIFNLLLGMQPVWVSAVGHRALGNRHADVGFVTLSYPNSVLAHIHVSWADPNKVRELVVVGSDRRIVFDDINAIERVKVYEKGVAPEASSNGDYSAEHHLVFRDGDIFSPRLEPSEPLRNQTLDFIEAVQTGRTALSDGHLGLQVVRVMEAIDRSMERNGTPVLVQDGTAVSYEQGATVVDLHRLEEPALRVGEAR